MSYKEVSDDSSRNDKSRNEVLDNQNYPSLPEEITWKNPCLWCRLEPC